ncbi:hypothetical protein GCM10009022_06820 [Vreelandella titanicae]|tara:strand:+ start:645 stop:1238 length:594 start_codon:yes stop_codon:yes gene_type:complete
MKKIVINVAFFWSILITSVSHADCACDKENDPGTPINQAILSIMDVRDNALALKLLDEGMDPDTTNACGAGLLLMSAYYNDIYLAQELLSKGADPNITNFSGETPVFAAAYISRNKILEMLLMAGGNPNPESECMEDKKHNTPLLIAAANNNIDGIKILAEHGANIHYINSEGYSLERIVNEKNIEELYYLFSSSEE